MKTGHKKLLVVFWVLWAAGPWAQSGIGVNASHPMPDSLLPGDVYLDIGSVSDKDSLGFGWSRIEGRGDKTFRWISHLEADLRIELPKISGLDLWIRAAPMYIDWKRQRIGLYVNNRFVAEQNCPDSPDYNEYHFFVPGSALNESTNRFTLRMGYRYRSGNDRRELSLAVDQVLIRPR